MYKISGEDQRLQATNADTYAGYEMTNDAQGWTTGVNNNDDYVINDGLQFGGDNIITIQNGAPVNTLYIKDTGNIGIGTNNPSNKMSISGNLSVTGNMIVNGLSGYSGTITASQVFTVTNGIITSVLP